MKDIGRFRVRLGLVSALVFALCGLGQGSLLAQAQGFHPVRGHVYASLEAFQTRHYHAKAELDLLAGLRKEVHGAVRQNNPAGAVVPLKRITVLEPHDYCAWEFLSYTYSVMGDASSAANVDLDTIAYFEFTPEAASQVSRAMSRLQIFDPGGWERRVQDIRATRVPQVPIQAIDHFVDIVRPDLSPEGRSIAYSKVETVLEERDRRVTFINRWKENVVDRDAARVEVETQETWTRTVRVVREIREVEELDKPDAIDR